MFSERVELRLRDILANIAAAEEYLGDVSQAGFAQDRKTMDAIERCLQRITEAAIQIGEEEMSRIAPALPFALVRGLGNRLRHEYHRIDAAQIYVTVRDELPPFRKAIEEALQK